MIIPAASIPTDCSQAVKLFRHPGYPFNARYYFDRFALQVYQGYYNVF